MPWAKVLILLFTLSEAGWMAFDGTQAVATGDFITPRLGPSAGQLGPWRYLVDKVGLNPRGTAMKVIFAVYGWTWLAVGVAFAIGASWSWQVMVFAAAGALWFLPLGTLLSVIQLALLFALRERLR